MNEEKFLKKMNAKGIIINNIDKIIDVFCIYYGEDLRELITEKFKDIMFMPYFNPESLRSDICCIEQKKSEEIFNKVVKENKTSIDIMASDCIQNNNNNIDYYEMSNIYYFNILFEDFLKGKDRLREDFINEGFEYVKQYSEKLTFDEYKKLVYDYSNKETLKINLNTKKKWIIDNIQFYLDIDNYMSKFNRIFNSCQTFLKQFDYEITAENIWEEFSKPVFRELKEVAGNFDDAFMEYTKYKDKFSSFNEYSEKVRIIRQDLSRKYNKEFIKSCLRYIPDDKRNGIQDYIDGKSSSVIGNEFFNFVFGFSIESMSDLECFSEENNQILQSNGNEWKKQQIIRKRIEYFKLFGIDNGNNYDDYLKDSRVMEIFPDTLLVEKFLDNWKIKLDQFNNEFFNCLPENIDLRNYIDSLDLLDKDDGFNSRLYVDRPTCVSPNLKRNNDTFDVRPILYFNCDRYSEYLDHFLIHELNHVFELSLLNVDQTTINFICGWDLVKGCVGNNLNNTVDKEKRDFELLNEIINELISQDISKLMLENNIFIFNTKEDSKYKGATSYEYSYFLVKDFFEEFKDIIIKSRRDNNIQLLFDAVGKENFLELNNLFHIYYDNFSSFMNLSQLYDDLDNNKDSDLVRIYNNLKIERDNILKKMKENYLEYNNIHSVNK